MRTEYDLKVNDFEQLIGSLSTFDETLEQSCCQVTIGRHETTMFNKFMAGKSDLFTSAICIDEEKVEPDEPESLAMFIPNVKKLIVILKNIGKYYDIKDMSLFNSGKIKILVCSKSSYVRIASPKYNIKFQLATNAVIESQLGNIEKVLVPSKYGNVVHNAINKDELQSNFLIVTNVSSGKFSEVNDLLATLSETDNASIKIQIPEQAKIEADVNPNPLANTLYATVSDNHKLVKSNIGNKVSVEFGKITFAAENYVDVCCTTSVTENFVFLFNKDKLDLISRICRSFTAASKAKEIEIVISKKNLIHLNLNMISQNCKSELYVTLIGTQAAAMF